MSAKRALHNFGKSWPVSHGLSFGLSYSLGLQNTALPAVFHDFANDRHIVDGVVGTFSDFITFARDSEVNGWVDGPVLNTFATDAPAFVIDPATGQSLGYRALAGFTNSLLWNRDLSNAVWSSVSDIALSRDSVGVDGTANTAWTATDTGTSFGRFQQDIAVSDDSNTHTVSVFIKKDSDETRFPAVAARARGGTTELNQVTQINTKTGAFSDVQTDGSASIEDGGSWWLITLTITNNGSGNTTLQIDVFPAHGDTFGSASGGATGSIVYDFGGVYLNSIAGPPIETEGSPVSTAADDATESVPTSLQSAGTLLISARTANGLSGDQVLAQMDDGTENNRVRLVRNSSQEVHYIVTDGGTEVANMNLGTVADDTDTKVAIRYGEDDYAGIISGGTLQTDTTGTMPSISTLRHGRDTADGEEWNGTIANVRGDDAYTDSQLEGAA